ncbi:type II toxin-antitoxin system HicB family antitoxin [Aurantiacibacter suaedae]|uniref:type II toxin-antitoxin system HicB family antitoxin n=1 Tax=Aurantiacibacter suaedae TaxID=2545755 RepID=UPI0019D53E66|nr:type II toxin-antitoxin system HicB family antitoxin [Aurantiacibacter suaedae]
MRARLDWDAPLSLWCWQTATETLLEIGVEVPTHGDAAKAGAVIRRMNGGYSRRSNGHNLSLVPPKSDALHSYDDNPEWTEADFAKARTAAEAFPPAVIGAFGKGKPARPAGNRKPNAKQSAKGRDVVSETGRAFYCGIVERGEDSFYISFPNLPVCVAAADDMQALATSAEAVLKLHLSGMLDHGESLPAPSDPLAIEADPDVTEVALLMVGADVTQSKVRVNVMFDRALLAAIDAASANRSRFLADAAREKLAGVVEHDAKGIAGSPQVECDDDEKRFGSG